MSNKHEVPASPGHTVIEYGIRYTEIGRVAGDPKLKRRTKYKLCSLHTAARVLQQVRAMQEGSPLCPEVDAAIVTRTLTFGPWTEQADQGAGPGATGPEAFR
ncbi:hypothetical protein HD597_011264 [Nonomuraea thailandensis]|uniref:Uncharacterized protein n=1 Tax=Nonomuraea thailandensis TaxID=1188745 RepID=A0A9X2GRG7_9ACTN|nr:hypothetical protein [Nonomuraea thailandensis]MCP2364244.1 hypothetical protein [Nonomuraea thailandensis]